MKFHFNYFLLIFFTVFLCFSFSIGSISQAINNSYTYNEKTGDSNTYDIIKADSTSGNYVPSVFPLNNGTTINYNEIVGDKIEFKVVVVNQTDIGMYKNVPFITEKLITPDRGSFLSSPIIGLGIINPPFNDSASAMNFYNNSVALHSSIITTNGDFISSVFNLTLGNETLFLNEKYNFRTGWLESSEDKIYFSNGTLSMDQAIQRESPTINNSLIGYSIDIIEIGVVIIPVAIISLISYSYYKFRKVNIYNNRNSSFTRYMQEKVKYSSKKSKQEPMPKHTSDKALDMIDEILKENENK